MSNSVTISSFMGTGCSRWLWVFTAAILYTTVILPSTLVRQKL